MIRPVKGVTVSSQSKEAEKNEAINAFIRQGTGAILPRNYHANETLRKMFERDDDDGGDLNGRD